MKLFKLDKEGKIHGKPVSAVLSKTGVNNPFEMFQNLPEEHKVKPRIVEANLVSEERNFVITLKNEFVGVIPSNTYQIDYDAELTVDIEKLEMRLGNQTILSQLTSSEIFDRLSAPDGKYSLGKFSKTSPLIEITAFLEAKEKAMFKCILGNYKFTTEAQVPTSASIPMPPMTANVPTPPTMVADVPMPPTVSIPSPPTPPNMGVKENEKAKNPHGPAKKSNKKVTA
jgi:hypothetical protein